MCLGHYSDEGSTEMNRLNLRRRFSQAAVLLTILVSSVVYAKTDKPNILVIWGDDVGMYNISAYHRGMMGGSTPNIDRIASEGAIFTDAYAQQSCTAGRASFVLGQHPFRTGLLTMACQVQRRASVKKTPPLQSY